MNGGGFPSTGYVCTDLQCWFWGSLQMCRSSQSCTSLALLDDGVVVVSTANNVHHDDIGNVHSDDIGTHGTYAAGIVSGRHSPSQNVHVFPLPLASSTSETLKHKTHTGTINIGHFGAKATNVSWMYRAPSCPEISQLSWNCPEISNCPEILLIWSECPDMDLCYAVTTLVYKSDYVYVADVECQVIFSLVTFYCFMCNIALVTFLGLQYWSASMINIYEHRKTCIFLYLEPRETDKSVVKLSWNFLKIWAWNFTSCCWEPWKYLQCHSGKH